MRPQTSKRNQDMGKSNSLTKAAPAPMDVVDKKYQAEDDLRTLKRAGEVTSDKARLAAAKREGKREQAALAKVVGGGKKKPASRSRR